MSSSGRSRVFIECVNGATVNSDFKGHTATAARSCDWAALIQVVVPLTPLSFPTQASYDPATIANLLQQHPYHVDSLLAMHDLYRHMGGLAHGWVSTWVGGRGVGGVRPYRHMGGWGRGRVVWHCLFMHTHRSMGGLGGLRDR